MTTFAVIQETSSLVLRMTRNPSLITRSLEYLHPAFFNILVSNCQFSGELSLDFIFTVASIIDNVFTLKHSGIEWQKAQKHNQLCSGVTAVPNGCAEKATRAVHSEGKLSSEAGSLNGPRW